MNADDSKYIVQMVNKLAVMTTSSTATYFLQFTPLKHFIPQHKL